MSDIDPLGGAMAAVQACLDEVGDDMGELNVADLAREALVGGGFGAALDQPAPDAVSDESLSVHTHLIEFLESDSMFNANRSWARLVCDELRKRRTFGLRKYGTVLHANNGRATLADMLAEVIDALAYCQVKLEQATTQKDRLWAETRRLRLITMTMDIIEEQQRMKGEK